MTWRYSKHPAWFEFYLGERKNARWILNRGGDPRGREGTSTFIRAEPQHFNFHWRWGYRGLEGEPRRGLRLPRLSGGRARPPMLRQYFNYAYWIRGCLKICWHANFVNFFPLTLNLWIRHSKHLCQVICLQRLSVAPELSVKWGPWSASPSHLRLVTSFWQFIPMIILELF